MKSAVMMHHEMWQVPERSFIPWLLDKRTEGYTLVGLEQTDCSVSLPDYTFRAATVLVIGREREGISEEILQVNTCPLEKDNE